MRKVYPALLSPDESGGFFIRVPDVNGCITTGRTPAEALDNIRDALAGCLCVLEDVGQPLPEPSVPADVADNRSWMLIRWNIARKLIQKPTKRTVPCLPDCHRQQISVV